MLKPDQLGLLTQAEQFRRAAITLGNDRGDRDEHVLYPMFVLYAFATELYLKFVHYVSHGTPASFNHDLRELFNGLPRDQQTAIRAEWARQPPGAKIIQRHTASINDAALDFDESLNASRNYFEEWRYAFEGKPKGPWLAGEIMESIRRHIFTTFDADCAKVRLPLPANALPVGQIRTGRSTRMPNPPGGPNPD